MIKKNDLPLSMVIFQAPKAWPGKKLGRIPFLPLTLTANNNCKLLLNDGY
jgi:hypothetical protein